MDNKNDLTPKNLSSFQKRLMEAVLSGRVFYLEMPRQSGRINIVKRKCESNVR